MIWATVIRSPNEDATRVILATADTLAEAEALAADSESWAETVRAEAAPYAARVHCPDCRFNFSLEVAPCL